MLVMKDDNMIDKKNNTKSNTYQEIGKSERERNPEAIKIWKKKWKGKEWKTKG